MKRLLLIAVLLAVSTVCLLVPTSVAQTPDGGTIQPPDATIGQVTEAAKDIIVNWKQLGVLGIVIAAINLIMLALRIPLIDNWFENKGIKWVKAWVAPALGAVVSILVAIKMGAGWETVLQAGLAGLMSGMASVGGHQMATKSNDTDKTEYVLAPGGAPGK